MLIFVNEMNTETNTELIKKLKAIRSTEKNREKQLPHIFKKIEILYI